MRGRTDYNDNHVPRFFKRRVQLVKHAAGISSGSCQGSREPFRTSLAFQSPDFGNGCGSCKNDVIIIALVGNPNCGKSTFFNMITGANQYVGNRPGVTVEIKSRRLKYDKSVLIADLPGIYSLFPFSGEERIAGNYLLSEKPDVIINLLDGTNLERNLLLTTQLLELDIPLVAGINMMDAVRSRGDVIDIKALSEELGCPVAEVSAASGEGVEDIIELALTAAKNRVLPQKRHFGCRSGFAAEKGDINKRYRVISGITDRCVVKKESPGFELSDRIDHIVTNRFFAVPILLGVVFLIYFVSISSVGAFAGEWVSKGVFGDGWYLFGRFSAGEFKGVWIPGIPSLISDGLHSINTPVWLQRLIIEGIVGGVGAVLGFLPQILVLFFLLSFLEGCGYMSRIAFILNDVFAKIGLSGKSFIPVIIGTGCSVPGILATRTIEKERERRLTVIVTSFMPCGAKLPVIALIGGAFFGGAWWVAACAYLFGIIAIAVSGVILKKTKVFAGDSSSFLMELPAYRLPNLEFLLKSTWEQGRGFIKKAGTVILLFSVIIWLGSNGGFDRGGFYFTGDLSESILAAFGGRIARFFVPLGFGDWQSAVAVLTGLAAKENIAGAFGVLFGFSEAGQVGMSSLREHFTAAGALSFLVFNLLCPPCIGAVAAIRRELNSWGQTLAVLSYQTVFAYGTAFCVNQLGKLFLSG